MVYIYINDCDEVIIKYQVINKFDFLNKRNFSKVYVMNK